jgi:hypothetical protein
MSFKLTPSNFLEISHRVSPFLTVYIKYSPAFDVDFSVDAADAADDTFEVEAGVPFL